MSESPLSSAEIRKAFAMPIVPIPVSWSYRVRMAGVVAGLILLQAAYVAIVAAVAALGVAYAWGATAVLAIEYHFSLLLLAVIPALAIAIAVIFLLKPLVVRPPEPLRPLVLQAAEEPVLFAYVEALCAKLGAPVPRRILVNQDANASASLAGWAGFVLGRVELTIGLPLADGLDLAQFTGVLAHEFGHFAQTYGMRSHFLIGRILGWFHRVAFERDRWDAWLELYRPEADLRLRAGFWIARAVVAASRWVLAKLFVAGRWLAAAFSRQMEYDADRYEAAVVGPAVFASTTRELPLLQQAAAEAWESTDAAWAHRRLPVSFPALAAAIRARYSDEFVAQVTEAELEAETGRWATHPAAKERIAHVERVGLPHFFPLVGRPARLFSDLEALAERATRHHLEQTVGQESVGAERVPAETAVNDWIAQCGEQEQVARLLGANPEFLALWLWPDEATPRDRGAGERGDDPDYAPSSYGEELETALLRFTATVLERFGHEVMPGAAFRLNVEDGRSIYRQFEEAERALEAIYAGYRAAAGPRMAWIEMVIARADDPELTAAWSAWAALGAGWPESRRLQRLAVGGNLAAESSEGERQEMFEWLLDEQLASGRRLAAVLGEPAPATAEEANALRQQLERRARDLIVRVAAGVEAVS